MKIPKPLFFMQLLLLQVTLSAQVQWYQNQDGNNQLPNGTVGVSVQSLTNNSFIACYQWNVNNDQYTWKISKSHINGTEQRCFFITGPSAQVEVKAGHQKSVYVFERSFPMGQNPQYILYKLDTNLNIKTQKIIEFPNSFNIFNMNAFQLDNSDNVYFAGDGQYPDGPGFNPASFVLKADKNLVTKWSRMDSTQTSFTRLHIDRSGNVLVVADFYTFFPDVHITRITPNGQHANTVTVHTNAGRFNLFSTLDDDDNLLMYGGKFVGDTAQAMYLYKISRSTRKIIYSKTHFISPASQLNDLKVDKDGNIFTLVWQYFGPNNQVSKISRINPHNGNIYWNRSFNYAHDSCNLFKLVMNGSDRFFVVGEKRCHDIYSKGFALNIKKNGQTDGNYPAPDSVAFLRSHWLADGITDRNNQLIAIGSTNDLDSITYTSTYLRSFAVRYENNHHNCDNNILAVSDAEETTINNKLVVYPNPVQNQLNVANLNPEEYDQLAVYTMQGAMLFKKPVNGTTVRVDVTTLPDAIYLLILRSTITLKEKHLTFVVKK